MREEESPPGDATRTPPDVPAPTSGAEVTGEVTGAESGESSPKADDNGPEADEGERRVDEGTSQELVIVNFGDDQSFGTFDPSRDPLSPASDDPPGADGTNDAPSPSPQDSLIIVRNMADQFALEEHAGAKPKAVEMPPMFPGDTDPPAAPPTPAEPGAGSAAGVPTDDAGDSFEGPPKPPSTEALQMMGRSEELVPEDPPEVSERKRELADVLGVDWDSELSHRPDPEPVVDPIEAAAAAAARSPGGSPAARAFALVSFGIFAVATTLMVLRIEPFATWYYLFAWYPFLAIINHVTASRRPEFGAVRPRGLATLSLLAWSVPIWLVFEVFNFRLENWYYVGVPDQWPLRRLGVALSFATVLPGIFFLEEAQRTSRWFQDWKTPRFTSPPPLANSLLVLAGIWTMLILALPQFFFPLVWGIPVLLLEPWLFRTGGPSLLRDLTEGRPGRILRLLVAGLGCGVFWESANFFAGGKWIYTVPGFETGKLFEMPFLGFLGFPPFALCCWCMSRALVQAGLMREWDPDVEPRAPRGMAKEVRAVALAGTVVFSFVVLEFVDRRTVDSFTGRPEHVPGIPEGVAEYADRHGARDVRGLIRLIDENRLYVPGASSAESIEALADMARLSELRGIGTENARRLRAAGIGSIEDLALIPADEVTARLAALDEPGWEPRAQRVAVWVRAARREFSRGA